ncbi:unnamed protein product [Paramecium sonneborni]|uniref:Uncharacterized protein n=1 Tax=Paramecium sonneborni TaxID=65129 RepID=A0A8S1MG00_9CILI|nr:unnamed protein product [Paramecium sonneborni]
MFNKQLYMMNSHLQLSTKYCTAVFIMSDYNFAY